MTGPVIAVMARLASTAISLELSGDQQGADDLRTLLAHSAPAIDLGQFRKVIGAMTDFIEQDVHVDLDILENWRDRLLALIDGQAGRQNHPDTERINFIEGECLAVEAVTVRVSEDDADVAWVISQDHMRQGKVVLHRSHDDNLRRAIDAVMQPNKGEGVAGGR